MSGRVETIGDCTLYLGDCLEVMASFPPCFRVDAVITDPPFGIWFKYDGHVDDADAYPAFMRRVVAGVDAILDGGVAVCWQGMPNADRWHEWFPKGFRLFAACKGFTQYRPVGVQYSWDPVVFWGKPRVEPAAGRRDWHAQLLAPFGAGREKIDHPCPRPIEQVCSVVETFTEEGQTVFDPFLGSGTTGIACARLGRKFIGVEIHEPYFETACRRIEEAYRQPRLFAEPKAFHKQEAFL